MSILNSEGKYNKTIHDCIKRTIIFSSGKPFNLSCCSVDPIYHNMDLCQGNSNVDSPQPNYDGGEPSRGCRGCAFFKKTNTFAKSIHFARAALATTKNMKGVVMNDILIRFLHDKVRKMCYLTFSNSDLSDCENFIMSLSDIQLIKLICDIDDFCIENNIE